MAPTELRDLLRQNPFEPFRIVLSDGAAFDIRHPDLLWVGQQTAYVGLIGEPGQTFFERSLRVDLWHVVRVEPLQALPANPPNGSA